MKSPKRSILGFLAGFLAVSFCSQGNRLAWPDDYASPAAYIVLERAGKGVVRFLDELAAVKCTELVRQIRLAKNGKTEYEEESSFDYLVLPQTLAGEVSLVESRQAEKEARHKKDLPLLVTNGFSTLALIFHPAYQASFEFTPLDDEVLDGRRYARVHFRHIKGTRSTAVLVLRGREYPIDLEGAAWIDQDTGWIRRISAGLEFSIEDVGLRTLRTDVEYGPVPFPGVRQPYWLPATATVEVETPRQHWRNIHQFSSYQRFSTSVKSTIGESP